MSFFHRFPHLRRKPRPKVVRRGDTVYSYDTKHDTYRSDDGGILDVAIVASLLSGGNNHSGYTASEETHTPAPDFVPAGGESSGAGSSDSFSSPVSESPSVSESSSFSDSGGGGGDGGGGGGGGGGE